MINSLPSADSGVRLAELMASLSMATDLGMGQPMEHAMTTCVLAVRLGAALGMDEAGLRDVYYEALLRYIGCNADTSWMASIVGDELTLRAAVETCSRTTVDRTPLASRAQVAVLRCRRNDAGSRGCAVVSGCNRWGHWPEGLANVRPFALAPLRSRPFRRPEQCACHGNGESCRRVGLRWKRGLTRSRAPSADWRSLPIRGSSGVRSPVPICGVNGR